MEIVQDAIAVVGPAVALRVDLEAFTEAAYGEIKGFIRQDATNLALPWQDDFVVTSLALVAGMGIRVACILA